MLLGAFLQRGCGPLDTGVGRVGNVSDLEPLAALLARLNNFGGDHQLFLDNQEASVVVVHSAVVSARADCDALATGEAVHTVLTNLVSAQQNLQLIVLQELVDKVRAEQRHIVLLEGISNQVRVNAQDVIVKRGVRPEELHSGLLCLVVNLAESDLEGPLNFLNVFDLDQGRADTSVNAEYLIVRALVVDNSGQRHVFKHIVKLLEDRVGIVDVFTKASCALLAETMVPVNVAILVVSSQQEDLLGVLQLKSHQQADHLERLRTLVHIVTQEKIIVAGNVTGLRRATPNVQEPHQIDVISMNVAENFDWRLE